MNPSSFQIITTIGPSSRDKVTLKRLEEEGATSFRINLSHTDMNELKDYYERFKEVGIKPCIDTQGAQVRICETPSKDKYTFGERIAICHQNNNNAKDCDLVLNHIEFFSQLEQADILKIGFDGLTAEIISIDIANCKIIAEVRSNGKVAINKAVDISGKHIELDSLTQFDRSVLSTSYKENIDTIFLSFCNCSNDIKSVKKIINNAYPNSKSKPKLIAKIETQLGVYNLDEIANFCDGILVDRGDLSREIRISKIPIIVNSIIETCMKINKPCFIATNILDTMIKEPLPSRAEISDIYNLLEQGVSGIVLAAEVAIGENPVECVQVIKHMSILYYLEKKRLAGAINNKNIFPELPNHLKSWL